MITRYTFILVLSFLLPIQFQSIEKERVNRSECLATSQNTILADSTVAIQQLLKDADTALGFSPFSVTDNDPIPPSKRKNDFYSWSPYLWPNPATKDGYPYINKDGETNPETEGKSDKPLLRKMAAAVYTLTLGYTYSGEKKYAEKAVDLLSAWFLDPARRMNPNLDFGQCVPGIEKGVPAGIIDTRWFILVVDAIPILRKSGALSMVEEAGLKQWFSDYLQWLQENPIGMGEGKRENNHGTWYAAQTASYALFTGNDALAKSIVANSRHYLDSQIDSMGRQTHELTRTKSFDYSLYNLHGLMRLATIGNRVGVDLWHYNTDNGKKQNIRESIRYMAQFGGSDKKWPYQQIAEKSISLSYGDGNHFSTYYPYDLYSALRIGFQVYRDPYFQTVMKELPSASIRKNRANLAIPMP